MTDTPKEGETVVASDSKTTVTTPAAPPTEDKTQETAVDELKKQLAQKEMLANQLANKLKAKEDADAAAEAAKLEENNQFKELHEQEKAKRLALEQEIEEKEKKAELSEAKQKILSEFSDEVKAIAETTGMDLTDSDETTVAAFKEKLEKINTRLGTAKISPNNPGAPSAPQELSGDELKLALQDDDKFHEIVTQRFPGIAAMTKQKE